MKKYTAVFSVDSFPKRSRLSISFECESYNDTSDKILGIMEFLPISLTFLYLEVL